MRTPDRLKGNCAEDILRDAQALIQQAMDLLEVKELALMPAFRRKRTGYALARGMRPHHVAPNALLWQILLRRPRNVRELREIRGMGPARARWASDLLELYREVLAEGK